MILKIENLRKKFGNQLVLNDINIDIEDHHIIGMIGPSGGGKSTLLRMIAGFEPITSGEISINSINVKENEELLHKKCGFVFQSHNLFLHLNILDNITIILEKVHKIKKKEAIRIAKTLLTQFGLIEHILKKPSQLSGGQSQRVALVRALAINPDVLLFDEPTSSLDPVLTYEVLDAILKLKDDKKDFIIVTHEIGFVKQVADYIVFIHEGRLVEHGDVSIIDEPKTEELQNFLSKVFSWRH
ncbi:MAG TPA: amino acid ABC transporter ATP-binding protein [Clostridia bacterium]|nr:amino acid ABC transporter ATP-binding protein [Clostridia bacterium]